MKDQTTKSWVQKTFPRVICVGYCGLQNLLSCSEPRWYTAGVYGWNANIYMVDIDTVIVTGYRPFGKYNGNPASRKYEELADEVNKSLRFIDYDKRKAELNKLMSEFVREVCGDAEA